MSGRCPGAPHATTPALALALVATALAVLVGRVEAGTSAAAPAALLGAVGPAGAVPTPRGRDLAEPAAVSVRLSLQGDAASRSRSALDAWNATGGWPRQDGIVHEVPNPPVVLATRAAGGTRLATSVVVDGAERVRVHLADVALPPGTLIWTWGENHLPQGPLRVDESADAGGLWSPSAPGPRVQLTAEVPLHAPAGAYGFRVDRVAQIVALDAEEPRAAADPCLVDLACVTATPPAVELAKAAIGRIRVINGGASFVCTGGLIADTDDTSAIPWFLTASHCIGTAAQAASVEILWDYERTECNGVRPSEDALPKSFGATLVADDPARQGAPPEASDFALLRLSAVPAPRYALGWTTDPVAPGETIFRVHHPDGDVRHYAESVVCAGCPACSDLPPSGFLYEDVTLGMTMGGSSGAPSFVDRGSGPQVVGQLAGICGTAVQDPCSLENRRVDGRFSVTFESVREWLSPGDTTTTTTTTTTSSTTTTTIARSDCRSACRAACKQQVCAGRRGAKLRRCVARCAKPALRSCRRAGVCF